MGLDAVGAGDDEDRVIKHLQGALCLRRKIDVAGGVEQGQPGFLQTGGIGRQVEHGLLGKDCDAAGAFHRVGIKKSVAVVHPPQLAQNAGAVEHRFGQRRFAAVNMGQNADDQSFHTSPCRRGGIWGGRTRPGPRRGIPYILPFFAAVV